MAAVLCTRFPDKAPELWAYQATIVRAERNYDGKRWVAYDRQFRCEALARKDLNWSITDPRLYNEAFTGRARSISSCMFCLQDDHTAAYCPHNPNRPVFGWFPDLTSWPSVSPPANTHLTSYPKYATSQEICRRYNDGRCKQIRCKYRHACSGCQGAHPYVDCSLRLTNHTTGRSRSPQRPTARGPPAALPGQRY